MVAHGVRSVRLIVVIVVLIEVVVLIAFAVVGTLAMIFQSFKH